MFKDRVFQNVDTRDNKNLPTGRGVSYLHRFQRHMLRYTNSNSVQEVHAFSRPGSVLQVQISPITAKIQALQASPVWQLISLIGLLTATEKQVHLG